MEFSKNIFVYFLITWCALSTINCQKRLHKKNLVQIHKWTELKFTFPTEQEKWNAIENGFYQEGKAVPVDLDVEYGDDGYYRIFLAIPRLETGIPYSLAVVSDKDNKTLTNPEIEAYPNYNWHSNNGAGCKGIISAIRLFIDTCWRLWIIDSGQVNAVQMCPPQVLAFDLVSDKLVHQYTIPEQVYIGGVSVFTAATVDVGDSTTGCSETRIYIADPWGYGLIVYDVSARRSWRIEHDFMRPDIELQNVNSAIDGIFTVSLSPKSTTKQRMLFFHSLNSYKEISVPVDMINNQRIWETNPQEAAKSFKIMGHRATQCESEVMDSAGNLFCALISFNALIRWNHETEYNSDTLQVVGYNPQQLQFVTGLKINRNPLDEDELWALSSIPKVFSGERILENEIKFQILGCRTSDLVNNRMCTVAAMEN